MYHLLREEDADLIFLQETRKELISLTKYKYFNKIRENSNEDGIAIGVKAPTIFRDLSDKLPDLLKDEEILYC
jgi:hypothetical protein